MKLSLKIVLLPILATIFITLSCSDHTQVETESSKINTDTTTHSTIESPSSTIEEDKFEDIIPNAIKRTMILYAGPEETWPFNLIISKHGEIPLTKCGEVIAGYCTTDNTIAFSSDFMLEATQTSSLAIPFIIGHELAHGFIINTGTPPKNQVLHELAADCLSGQMMVIALQTNNIMDEMLFHDLANFTHKIGDSQFKSIDHHGFGSQRYIAYSVGQHSKTLATLGDNTHENDCVALFSN